jgi:hypothetical protein
VRDHDHNPGRYCGPLCSNCNLQTGKQDKRNRFIPTLFHNLKGYDSHLIFEGLKRHGDEYDKVTCVPLNGERFISFSFNHQYRFLDSMNFLNSLLDTLLGNLENEHKHHLWPHFVQDEEKDEAKFELVTRKGYFPYEWFDSLEKLDATELPPVEAWSSKLTLTTMAPEEYEFVQQVWTEMGMQTFRDYHDFYLAIDVKGLADIIARFRVVALRDDGLDPLHYYILPGFSWDIMLKTTGVQLEQLSDPEMYTMCEKGIRGGPSVISHRPAKANNKYLEEHDATKPNSYLMYVDANNLYGVPMSAKLPVRNFCWGDNCLDQPAVMQLEDCILEVDVGCPTAELHDTHNDYPLLLVHKDITEADLSPYAKDCL